MIYFMNCLYYNALPHFAHDYLSLNFLQTSYAIVFWLLLA